MTARMANSLRFAWPGRYACGGGPATGKLRAHAALRQEAIAVPHGLRDRTRKPGSDAVDTTARPKIHNPPTIWPVPDVFRRIYSHAVEVPAGKRLLFISGQVGVMPDGSVAADFAAQCEQAMNNVEALLDAARMTRADMIKITYFLTRAEDAASLGQIRRRRWADDEPPAVTTVAVAALARADYAIEIEVIAAAP